jgi:Cu2+-containing amine oxidase
MPADNLQGDGQAVFGETAGHRNRGIFERQSFALNVVRYFRSRFGVESLANLRDHGLPNWTKANRKVDDTEITLWYFFAHNHVPRPEDWPVMPVAMLGFGFRPDGFFERNPAMDVPRPPAKSACCH